MKILLQIILVVLTVCLIIEIIMNFQLHPLINKVKDAAYYNHHKDNPYTNTKYTNFQLGSLEEYFGEYINGEIDFNNFLSVHDTRKGYVWCAYDITTYNEKEHDGGAKITSSVWDIEKIDGQWEIVGTHEKP